MAREEAIGKLNAFASEVEVRRDRTSSKDDADELIDGALLVIELLKEDPL